MGRGSTSLSASPLVPWIRNQIQAKQDAGSEPEVPQEEPQGWCEQAALPSRCLGDKRTWHSPSCPRQEARKEVEAEGWAQLGDLSGRAATVSHEDEALVFAAQWGPPLLPAQPGFGRAEGGGDAIKPLLHVGPISPLSPTFA